MIGETQDRPPALPLVTPPRGDELLSSWLTRIAQDYYVTPRGLLTHMGLSSPSVERLDLTLTFTQAMTLSGFVRLPPDAIFRMTHARLPSDCRSLVRVRHPQQSCRRCGSQFKRDGAAGAVLKSWVQGWRITCRVCGGAISDVWSDVDRAGTATLGRLEEEAAAGEAIAEAYANGSRTFPVSPATMMRLLLLRRRPTPKEFREQPEFQRRLIGTIIPDFDAIADDRGLNTMIGRSPVLPMVVRLRLLAGVAKVMENPIEQISFLRQSGAFGPQFDRVLAQDPIITPDPIPQSRLT
ncbi:MAG: TniQ family protein [Roseiarcus sp.]|jgi:hypothetical protein